MFVTIRYDRWKSDDVIHLKRFDFLPTLKERFKAQFLLELYDSTLYGNYDLIAYKLCKATEHFWLQLEVNWTLEELAQNCLSNEAIIAGRWTILDVVDDNGEVYRDKIVSAVQSLTR